MFPVTCAEVAKTPEPSTVRPKPVIAVAAAGLSPRLPVIADVGTVEITDLARTTYVPASPSSTPRPGSVVLPVVKPQVWFTVSGTPLASSAPVVIVTLNVSLVARCSDGQKTA